MGNIIGRAFRDGVKKQIDLRQKNLGLNSKNISNVQNFNNNNSFLRLISSVDIAPEMSQTLFGNNNYAGSKLAESFVLYNGITQTEDNLRKQNSNGDIITQNGISNSSNLINNGAYGFGGLEMGYRPMPGLISSNVSYINRGSLKTAEVQIKAFTPKQFEIIEMLYMRVGFTVLLEWGNSKYLDNDREELFSLDYFTTNPSTQVLTKKANPSLFLSEKEVTRLAEEDPDKLIEIKPTTETILQGIEKQREDYSYNYDAIYGKIKNFSWKFNSDGSYDIIVSIISLGDIIESLNINKSIKNTIKLNIGKEPKKDITPRLEKELLEFNYTAEIDNTAVDTPYLSDDLIFDLGLEETEKETVDKIEKKVESPPTKENKIPDYIAKNALYKFIYTQKQILDNSNPNAQSVDTNGSKFNLKGLKFATVKLNYKNPSKTKDSKEDPPSQYYIKLGYLLGFIQKNLLYYNKDINEPMVKIDYNPNTNFCLTFPQQFSSDPKVCLIPVKCGNTEGGKGNDEDEDGFFGKNVKLVNFWESDESIKKREKEEAQNKITNPSWDFLGNDIGYDFFTDNKYIGKLMHLHVNFNHILSVFNNLKSEVAGKVPLYGFLQGILNGINGALGGVNSLSVTYNNELNTIVIREDNNLAYDSLIGNKNYTKFNIYGFSEKDNKSIGSIVKDINFNVTVTPQFATMVSIGAQANANQLGENATLLSDLYKGSTDRINTFKYDLATVKSKGNGKNSPSDKININVITNSLKTLYKKFNLNETSIDTLKDISKTYSNYITGYLSNRGKMPCLGFFPFNLQLTLDGISGMRVYERFEITDRIFPSMYKSLEIDKEGNKVFKSKLNFIIKGVSHTIQDNKWTTTIDTLSVPAEPIYKGDKSRDLSNLEKPPTETTTVEGDYNMSQKLQAVLDTIAFTEGTDKSSQNSGYNILFGGKKWNDINSHPWDQSPQPKKVYFTVNGKKDYSTASGRYQFLKGTWNDLSKKYKLDNFKKDNQDIACILLAAGGKGFINNLEKGNYADSISSIKHLWASLPGAGYGQREEKMNKVLNKLNERLTSGVDLSSDVYLWFEKNRSNYLGLGPQGKSV